MAATGSRREAELKVYSDTLDARDIMDAAEEARMLTGSRASIEKIASLDGNLRTRSKGWEVRLWNPDSSRHRNSGTHGAATWETPAASWDDHGHWFAQIFRRDPEAKCANYNNAEEFHRITNNKYKIKEAA